MRLALFVLLLLGPLVVVAGLQWGSASPVGMRCRPVVTPDIFAVRGTLAAQIYARQVARLAPCTS